MVHLDTENSLSKVEIIGDLSLLCGVKAQKNTEYTMNCTPFVRQYDILDNKWGALLCQKEYQTSDTHQNLRN